MDVYIVKTQLNIGGIIYYLRHNYVFRPQYVGHLQVVYEELINKLYKHMWGGYIEGFLGRCKISLANRERVHGLGIMILGALGSTAQSA
jgi:hypothetical protein